MINSLPTGHHKLWFVSSLSITIISAWFIDADWADNIDDRTSTSAHVVFLGHNAISWRSKKQHTVARSSTEAEYWVVASITSEITWLQSLWRELVIQVSTTPTVYYDNIDATYLCANPIFDSWMKHIAIDFHFFVRKSKLVKSTSLMFSPTINCDALTKLLSHQWLHTFRIKIGVLPRDTILRAHIRKVS